MKKFLHLPLLFRSKIWMHEEWIVECISHVSRPVFSHGSVCRYRMFGSIWEGKKLVSPLSFLAPNMRAFSSVTLSAGEWQVGNSYWLSFWISIYAGMFEKSIKVWKKIKKSMILQNQSSHSLIFSIPTITAHSPYA